jgi:hypothetical protein
MSKNSVPRKIVNKCSSAIKTPTKASEADEVKNYEGVKNEFCCWLHNAPLNNLSLAFSEFWGGLAKVGHGQGSLHGFLALVFLGAF